MGFFDSLAGGLARAFAGPTASSLGSALGGLVGQVGSAFVARGAQELGNLAFGNASGSPNAGQFLLPLDPFAAQRGPGGRAPNTLLQQQQLFQQEALLRQQGFDPFGNPVQGSRTQPTTPFTGGLAFDAFGRQSRVSVGAGQIPATGDIFQPTPSTIPFGGFAQQEAFRNLQGGSPVPAFPVQRAVGFQQAAGTVSPFNQQAALQGPVFAGQGTPLFKQTMQGARAQFFRTPNPATGQDTWFRPAGRPILWSGDLTACKRVNKVARRAKRKR